MISKVITGKTFYGACRYICMDQKRAMILEVEGVRAHNYKLMAKDFELQQQLRPSLSKAVFHGILSFYPGEKIADETMIDIAKKYLQELSIKDTQYAITKHIDKDHQHVHILANLVNNNGETIKDSWIGLRGKKASQKLTLQYQLKIAEGKNLEKINLDSLNEKEANRYKIYQAILERLPHFKNINDLKQQLEGLGIETLYKYKGQTKELQGISFKIGEFRYKGSDIDRNFSIRKLQNILYRQQLKADTARRLRFLSTPSETTQAKYESNKSLKHDKSVLEELMKPEIKIEQQQSILPKKKKKAKSISRGW